MTKRTATKTKAATKPLGDNTPRKQGGAHPGTDDAKLAELVADVLETEAGVRAARQARLSPVNTGKEQAQAAALPSVKTEEQQRQATAEEPLPRARFVDLPNAPASKPPAAPGDGRLAITAAPGETAEEIQARIALHPAIQNAFVAKVFAEGKVPEQRNRITGPLDMTACAENMVQRVEALDGKSPMREGEQMLWSQAQALQSIFYEMARRAALNMGTYIEPAETYLRLALKAQSQCRATIETLGELKNPRPIYINPKQVNHSTGAQQVNNAAGPQQVNNGSPPVDLPQSVSNGAVLNPLDARENNQK